MLEAGASIPEFTLRSSRGRNVSASELRGQRYLLFFYPKDDTPGCTREACSFSERLPRFAQLGVPVFGVSADTDASHLKFVAKHQLEVELLADPELLLVKAAGVWVQKSLYGKTFMGVVRASFLVGPGGQIEKVWPKVKPETHADEVLAYLGAPAPGPAKKSQPRRRSE